MPTRTKKSKSKPLTNWGCPPWATSEPRAHLEQAPQRVAVLPDATLVGRPPGLNDRFFPSGRGQAERSARRV